MVGGCTELKELTMSEGMRNSLRYKMESSFGVDPGVNYTYVRKTGDAGVGLTRAQIKTEEMNSRRAVTGFRLGAKMPKVTVPFELIYSAYDDFISCAMMNAWTDAAAESGALTVTVATADNTLSATGIEGTGGGALSAGDWVKISGFAAANNNGWFKVTAVVTNKITLGEAKDVSGTTTLTAVSGATGVKVQKMKYITGSTLVKSVAFEEAQEDIGSGLFFQTLGNMCDAWDMSFQPDQIIKGTFNFLGKTYTTPYTSTKGGTIQAAPIYDPMQSNDALSYLSIDGTPVAMVTGLDFSLKNSLAQYLAVAGQNVAKIGRGDSDLTGTLTMFFDADTYWTKYLTETSVSLTSKFMDLSGLRGYAFDIPRIKFTDSTLQRAKDNTLQSLPFQALETTDKSILNMKIWALV
jgi:hypothetical protein